MSALAESPNLVEGDLSDEDWREYEFDNGSGEPTVYRIPNPQKLFFRKGGSTHRILDSKGVVHCVPAPGKEGCVLRWKTKDGLPPVKF